MATDSASSCFKLMRVTTAAEGAIATTELSRFRFVSSEQRLDRGPEPPRRPLVSFCDFIRRTTQFSDWTRSRPLESRRLADVIQVSRITISWIVCGQKTGKTGKSQYLVVVSDPVSRNPGQDRSAFLGLSTKWQSVRREAHQRHGRRQQIKSGRPPIPRSAVGSATSRAAPVSQQVKSSANCEASGAQRISGASRRSRIKLLSTANSRAASIRQSMAPGEINQRVSSLFAAAVPKADSNGLGNQVVFASYSQKLF
jgi:hypothetical protein